MDCLALILGFLHLSAKICPCSGATSLGCSRPLTAASRPGHCVVAGRFREAMKAYTEMIVSHHSENSQDPATNKAMMAMTRTIKRSLNCTPSTHQSMMHNFGKFTVANSRTKKGAVIKVNPPAAASRKFKVPGRSPAPLGRPLKERGGQVQLVVTDGDDFLSRSDKTVQEKPQKSHNISKNVSNNESLPQRHTNQ